MEGRQIVQGDLLADGGFAYVYRGHDMATGELLAIRRVLLQSGDAFNAAQYELALLRRLPVHLHIVRFWCGAIDKNEGGTIGSQAAVSVFELCTGGTLVARLEKAIAANRTVPGQGVCCPCLPEFEVIDVLNSMTSALAHLHGVQIVHYDVKSENVLLGSDDKWKLGDFGSASERTFVLDGVPRRQLLETEEFIHGRCTPCYRAPELADVHLRWPIGPKVDVFALGCVVFSLLTATHPFPMDSALANIQAKFKLPAAAEVAYTRALVRCVKLLLARHPVDRPASAELHQDVLGCKLATEQLEWVADWSAAPPAPDAPNASEHGVQVSSLGALSASQPVQAPQGYESQEISKEPDTKALQGKQSHDQAFEASRALRVSDSTRGTETQDAPCSPCDVLSDKPEQELPTAPGTPRGPRDPKTACTATPRQERLKPADAISENQEAAAKSEGDGAPRGLRKLACFCGRMLVRE